MDPTIERISDEPASLPPQIETERLALRPFTPELLRAAESGDAAEYAKLGMAPSPEWPEPDLVEALPAFHALLEEGDDGFRPWIVLDKDRRIVGSAGFLGKPGDGAIEIGFGIVPSERGKGYCSEAVVALARWAGQRRCRATLMARCEPDNAASISVLKKSGFVLDGNAHGLLEWSRPALDGATTV